MTFSYLWERLTKIVTPHGRRESQNIQRATSESSLRSERDVMSGDTPSSTSGPSIHPSDRVPLPNVDEFSELMQDQRALSSEFREKNRLSSELSDDISQSFGSLRSIDGINLSYVPMSRLSAEPCPSMLAENELLRQHYSSVRDLYESERARTDILRQELERWRSEANRWKSSSSILLRKLDKLRGAIASERADRMAQIARQAEKFLTMEKKLEDARLHHMITASALERTHRDLIKKVSPT